MELTYRVTDADEGRRAVDVLTSRTGMSRLMAKRIRLYGRLTCNGRKHRMIDPVHQGDVLIASLDPLPEASRPLRRIPEAPLLWQDDWLVIVNKPKGMVIHPTYLHHTGSLTDRLADYPLHPVTRLDRDTTGAVLIALNGHAHHVLASRPMHKIYVGLVHGRLKAETGLIQAPIRRHESSIMLREVHPDGVRARTRWQVIRYLPQANLSLVRFWLLTGRTHQIRVHCQAIGCPLVGDGLYGRLETEQATDADLRLGRQALHAASIGFKHPVSREVMLVKAPLAEDMLGLLQDLDTGEDWNKAVFSD